MMVIVNSWQLKPIIERTIEDTFKIRPTNILLDSRYYNMNQGSWEIGVEFDHEEDHHTLRLSIDPSTGFVQFVGIKPSVVPSVQG